MHKVANSWGLCFILDNCAMLCCQRGSADCSSIDPQLHYHMNNTALSIETTHKDLGNTIDIILKYHSHVSLTVKKAAGLANNVLKSTLCRDKDFMITLFKNPHQTTVGVWLFCMEYGLPGWLKTPGINPAMVGQTNPRNDGTQLCRLSTKFKSLLCPRKINLSRSHQRLENLSQSILTNTTIFFFSLSLLAHIRGHRFKVAKPRVMQIFKCWI